MTRRLLAELKVSAQLETVEDHRAETKSDTSDAQEDAAMRFLVLRDFLFLKSAFSGSQLAGAHTSEQVKEHIEQEQYADRIQIEEEALEGRELELGFSGVKLGCRDHPEESEIPDRSVE